MFKNEKILLTGANSGIGLSFVKKLITDNYIYCLDKDLSNLQVLKNDYPKNIQLIQLDLSDARSREMVLLNLKNENISVIINNVGIGYWNLFEKTNIDALKKIIEVNNIALIEVCHNFLSSMKQNNYGFIINLSSTGAFCGASNAAVYTATKAFIQNFSEALDMECSNSNVNVFTLYPGATKTNFWKSSGTINSKMYKNVKMKSSDETVNEFLDGIKNKRKNIISGYKNIILVLLSKIMPRVILKNLAYKKYN